MSEAPPTSAPRAATSPQRRRIGRLAIFLRLLFLLAILGFGFAATSFPPFDRWLTKERLIEALEAYSHAENAWLLHTALFVVLACGALPVTPLMLAAGYLFGFAWGAFYNWLGATVAAFASYGVARWVGGEAIEALLRRRLASFRTAGFRTTLWLRCIPVFPYAAVNFGAGAARVPFRSYAIATALGMIPSSITFTLFAWAATEVWREPNAENILWFGASILCGMLSLMIPFWLHRHHKRKLAAREQAAGLEPPPEVEVEASRSTP